MYTSLSPDAQEIAREFREYAYNVSHDLSAPVRGMVEFSRLLSTDQADVLSKDGKLYLALIIENGEKLYHMMDGLLAYSRLNTANPFSDVDCNLLLKNCLIVWDKIDTIYSSITEIVSLPVVNADAEQIMQLFMILLDNAFKFHLPGSKPYIRVSAQRQAQEWCFSIADNGIGIDPAFGQRIFKLFQRLHTDREYPGIGAGLALAQKIVHHHGGKIWFEPTPRQGTTFLFTIPDKGSVA